MAHDLRHDRILNPVSLQSRTAKQRTDLKIGESTTFATCHTLKLAPAEPEVPQSQCFGSPFQRFEDRGHDSPSLRGVGRDLSMIQLFRRQYIFLHGDELSFVHPGDVVQERWTNLEKGNERD